MKFLIHSNAPWMPTGYGKQALHLGHALHDLGHDVSYSAFAGLTGAPIGWVSPRGDEFVIYPSGMMPFGSDMIKGHAILSRADVIISLMDTYKLQPAADDLLTAPVPFVPFMPIDCTASNGGPSMLDQRLLNSLGENVHPVAISKFGQENLKAIGHDSVYVPHTVDTSVFKPMPEVKVEDKPEGSFIIGINAANRDAVRKSFPEQFEAFGRFSQKHPEARLSVFSVYDSAGGFNLAQLAYDLGIYEKVIWMPTFEQVAGILDDEFVAAWYNTLDVLSLCSYGEGFGVPLIEAQACGIPVIATDGSAMKELQGSGWLVKGQRWWNHAHEAWWDRPSVYNIEKAYDKAYQSQGSRSQKAVDFAQEFDLDHNKARIGSLIETL